MMLNELGEKGLNNVLQSRLNMVGGAPAPSLVPEVQSTLVLEADRPEYGYWKNETPFSGFVDQNGSGAEITTLYIVPPRGILIVIESIEFVVGGGNVWVLGMGPLPGFSLPTTIGNPGSRDDRFPDLVNIVFETGTCVAIPTLTSTLARSNNVSGFKFEGPYILADAKRGLIMRSLAAGELLRANIKGYLRTLLPNELV